ncbi:MAG: hypothetical protein ACUVXA_13820 [Candidatus Jordarchaeum sp.]|uniref:hypothetical protein n=1 Tax=Candidatus Jordarchaeum sp. TaxID=2823881 RepID=UPI00404A097A
MAKNIEIKETITDKNSEFNVKRFRVGTLEIDRPTKVIDAKNITKKYLWKKEDYSKKFS